METMYITARGVMIAKYLNQSNKELSHYETFNL